MARQTLPGEKQFTASAILITKESPKRILLVHHKKYNVWIQPGGHVEKFENPIECVVRETKEETGINIRFLLEEVKYFDKETSWLLVPAFFYEEKIPKYQDEPEHYHLDFFYKVAIPFQKVRNAAKESHGIGWFTLDEALKLPMFDNTKFVIQQVLKA